MPDVYANQGYVEVIPAAANTLTFTELATFVSVFEKKAFLINRISYYLSIAALGSEMDAETDYAQFGLTVSNTWTTPQIGEASIFDWNSLQVILNAAGVSGHLYPQPFDKDFSTMPGGGLLVPSRPIYLFLKTNGWAIAGSAAARIYFTVKDLKAEEYWELVEATRLVTSA